MNLLNKLTTKNLKLNKKRTIVTIIGITLSIALITAVSALFFSANASLINFEIKSSGNYHYSFKDVPKEEIEIFENNRNIESIYRVQNIGYAKLEESKNEYKPYAYITAFDQSSLDNLAINIVSGRLPKNENEIVIPTHLKTNGRINYKIGDTITLEVGKRVDSDGYELNQSNPYNPEDTSSTDSKDKNSSNSNEKIIETTTKKYKIVGIIERPDCVEGYSAPGYTFITLMTDKSPQKLDLYVRYNKNGLKNHDKVTANILGIDEAKYSKFINYEFSPEEYDELQHEFEKSKYAFSSNDYLIMLESGILKESTMQALATVVLVVLIIIIVTSVFCIKNSFDISITEKTKQYGMLSSIGATKKQIKNNVYFEALILGIIGIPLGIIFGLIAAYILIIISNIFMKDMLSNINLIFSFSIYPLIFAIILGLITIYLSAWKSAHRASKISPITAIRNSDDLKLNPKKLKSPSYIKKIFGIGGEISYKNLKRNKRKYRTTVISIIVCSSVFISLYYFINLAFIYVKGEFKNSDYNISLSYNIEKDSDLKNKIKEVLSLDNINDYARVSSSYVEKYSYEVKYSKEYLQYFPNASDKENTKYSYEDENGQIIEEYEKSSIQIYRIGDKQYKKYIKSLNLNYNDAKNKAILINYTKQPIESGDKIVEKTISVLDYKKGDSIKWYSPEEKKDINLDIISVTNKYPFGLSDYVYNPLIIISDELYDKLFTKDKHYEELLIYSNNATKLQDNIDEILTDFEYHLNNLEENVRTMKSFFTLIAIFLYGFIIVIALIGITNIFNTITTNMELRSREFATLKSIGMTTKEFNRMIRLESFFYGTKSLLIGIPIGCLLSYLIYRILSVDNSSILFTIPYQAIIITIIAVFLLITCIMKYSINKINKQNTIETIRNENI